MATFYIPDSTGWAEDHSGGTKLRFLITTVYDQANNRSTVTLMPQVMIASNYYRLRYNMLDNSWLTANGITLIEATGSGSSTNGLSFNLVSEGWKDISGSNGYTITVNHDTQGTATVSVTQAMRLLSVAYEGRQYPMSWGSYSTSGSESWSETPLVQYTLTLSAGTGSTVTVTRGGAALQNGATLQQGDVLTVNFGAADGYALDTHTVNGTTTASGSTVTVSSDVTVAATANVIAYTLSISAGIGTEVTVQRTSSPKQEAASGALTDGATLYDGDVLRASAEATSGYVLTSATLNGNTIPESHTVAGDVTVAATANVISYTLSISAGIGTEVTVQRTSSPKQGAASGALTDGATLYDGDVLQATAEAVSGYVLTSATLNGNAIPENHTVAGNVTVAATAIVASYTLTISAGTGTEVTVQRVSSPKQGAAAGTLTDGATLYDGDVLNMYFAADTGYTLIGHTVNGIPFISGDTDTVSGDVSVSAIAVTEETMKKLPGSTALLALISKIKASLRGKQAVLTFDTTPTAGSENPVTSGGVKAAMDDLAERIHGYPDGDEVSY